MASSTHELKRAKLWSSEREGRTRCFLCHHRCLIHGGKRGVCGVRENRDGTLYSLNYGRLISANVDPIEKKPLFHFHPSTPSLSIATVGCNLRCLNCQNATISQWPREHPGKPLPGDDIPAREIVEMALSRRCATVAYTYTEPTIFIEYAKDVASGATSAGLKNVFVTNGYMTQEALDFMGDDLHAANVDLKSADEAVMRRLTGAHAQPVLHNIRDLHQRGVWVEVTTLVIPGQNDTKGALQDIARFLSELDPNIPWHVSRFHPSYKLTGTRPTPPKSMKLAYEVGRESGLRYVYTGNVWGDSGESTRCPECGTVVISRYGFTVQEMALKEGRCNHCKTPIAGRGLP